MGADGTDNAQKATDLHLDCYAILGVAPNAGEAIIREAFETLARQYDPEHFAGSKDEAHRKMSELTSAYEILSDPVRRRRYDLHRRIDAWTAPVYASDPSRHERPPLAAVDRSDAAPPPRRYQILLPAVLAALVIVAVATAYRYSGRPTEEQKASRPAAAPVAADAKPTSAPQPTAPTPTAAAPARPSDAGASGAATTPAAPQAAATPQQETRPAPPKPAVAKSPPANRSRDATPAAAASEPCTDVAAVLGLCKRSSTVKDK